MALGNSVSKVVQRAVATVGLLLVFGGAALLIFTLNGLTSGDVAVALTPLATTPLELIDKQTTTMKVRIPDTTQWRRIERKWGKPDFVVAAVSPDRHSAYCLGDLNVAIGIEMQGTAVRSDVSYPPYGYSALCEGSSRKFSAALGTEPSVAISRLVQPHLPSGEIVVVAYWPRMKDKLAGAALEGELRPIAIAVCFLGFALAGVAVMIGRRTA